MTKKNYKELEPFVIYIFQKGETLYAASRVKKDGIDEVYGQGFTLEKDTEKDDRLNTPSRIRSRSRRSLVNSISNTLTVIHHYGKSVLDENGNVLFERVRAFEYESAKSAVKLSVTLDQFRPAYKYKTREIPLETAIEYNLI